MSFARGKFGIEYIPKPEKESSGIGWVFVVVGVVALVSFVWSLVGRIRARGDDEGEGGARPPEQTVQTPPRSPEPPAATPPPRPLPPRPLPPAMAERPAALRNLLMRLDVAERSGDVEMAVGAIEQIRALPGSPAADLDDSLARRLGALNVRRLFERRNAQWVKAVTVKRGDSASRIAAENGSTLASLARLNGGDVNRLVIGRTVYVMDHPRFNLVVHRRSRTADLSLNGKFFRRYDLADEVRGAVGAYRVPQNARSLWRTLGLSLAPASRDELETLLPAGAQVLVSEM